VQCALAAPILFGITTVFALMVAAAFGLPPWRVLMTVGQIAVVQIAVVKVSGELPQLGSQRTSSIRSAMSANRYRYCYQ
jgi:hypothetical protein